MLESSMGLTWDIIVVLAILTMTIVLSLSNFIRVDVVAVLVLVVIGLTRLLPPEQLFSGFSSEAVISLIAVMIIGAGLEKSGIALKLARWILKSSRERPNKINTLLMIVSGFLSAVMRGLGTVALLLPVVGRITARTGIPKSRLLMPMAFCSILGGMLTMIGTSPLILLNSLLKNSSSGLEAFHLFSIFPIGLALLCVGILYFIFFGKRLLPKEPMNSIYSGTTKKHFFKTYKIGGDIFELLVNSASPIVMDTIRELETKLGPELSVLAILQEGEVHFPPLRRLIIGPNATLAILGLKETVLEFSKKSNLELMPKLTAFAEILHPVRAGLSEAVIPPSSKLIGQELKELHMKRNYQLQVLAVLRGNSLYRGEELQDLILRAGDTLGLFSRWEALSDFHTNPDFVVLTTSYPREELRPKKMWFAVLFFVTSIILITLGKFPVSVGLLLGAVGMIGTGVLTIDEAYSSVSWKSVFLVAGLIPLGLVMQTTHTTDWITQHAPLLREDLPSWVIQTGLAFIATGFSWVMSGVGATIVLVPVALDLANRVGADPRIYALIVAIAASNTFLLPMHQVNALIAGPGGYRMLDFLKVGSGMTVLYWIIMLLMINWVIG
jgi:di/tricarboxylate transporter